MVLSYKMKINLPPLAQLVAQPSIVQSHYFSQTYRGKLVVELRQHGVVDEDGWVLLKTLQLFQETLLVLLAAVPGGHWLEHGFPRSITPLQNHHLHTQPNIQTER